MFPTSFVQLPFILLSRVTALKVAASMSTIPPLPVPRVLRPIHLRAWHDHDACSWLFENSSELLFCCVPYGASVAYGSHFLCTRDKMYIRNFRATVNKGAYGTRWSAA